MVGKVFSDASLIVPVVGRLDNLMWEGNGFSIELK